MTIESIAFRKCRGAVAACVEKNITVSAVAFIVTDYVIAELIIGNIENDHHAQTNSFGYIWNLHLSLDHELKFDLSLMHHSPSMIYTETMSVMTATITQCELITIVINNSVLTRFERLLTRHWQSKSWYSCDEAIPSGVRNLLIWTMKQIAFKLEDQSLG